MAEATPALSLAVANHHGALWSDALGASDLDRNLPAEPEHLFRIGSVSKVVTATLAAQLVSRGVIELDTPISYWMPDLPDHHRATTLRQLLTHRGGVRHYIPRDFDAAQPGGPVMTRDSWSPAQILDAFIHDELVAPPGEQVSYSSWGYSLASLVIETAAGSSFLDLVADEIADRFGLPSLVADEPARDIADRTRGYIGENERFLLAQRVPEMNWPEPVDGWAPVIKVNPAFCWAGAGMLMNMPDLARFGAAHLDGPECCISDAERKLLFTPLTDRTATSPPLGLGWRVDEDAHGRLRWHHAGATPGGRAGLVIYPAQGLSIALAGNTMTAPGDILGPASELADIFA